MAASSEETREYTWTGWDSGDELDPPEPGKEWLTISDPDGEELAVIVLRTNAGFFKGEPELLEQHRREREQRAGLIVDALNHHALMLGLDEAT